MTSAAIIFARSVVFCALVFVFEGNAQSLSLSQSGSGSCSNTESSSSTASGTASVTGTASPTPSGSRSPTVTQSRTPSVTQLSSPSSTQPLTPSVTASQSPTPSQTTSPIPGFCSFVTNGTCIVGSSIAARNCSGSNLLFNVSGDVSVQDLDVCTLTYDGNVLVLPNVTLTCNAPEVCHIVFNVTGDITLESGSFVSANTISVVASSLTVAAAATVSADALGFIFGPGAGDADTGGGGSHGGAGGVQPCSSLPAYSGNTTMQVSTATMAGYCCDGFSYFATKNASVGSWVDPLWTGNPAAGIGSGGGVLGAGRGGGRVVLSLGSLVVDGSISADGGVPASQSAPSGGAGSGGSVVVMADAIAGSGTLHANGGDAQLVPSSQRWAAGGGGRVSLAFRSNSLLAKGSVMARGGVYADASTSSDLCLNGAAGTVVLHQFTGVSDAPLYRELQVDNLRTSAWAITPLTIRSPGNASSDSVPRGSTGTNPDANAEVDTLILKNSGTVLTQDIILREAFTRMPIGAFTSDGVFGASFNPSFVGIQLSSNGVLITPRVAAGAFSAGAPLLSKGAHSSRVLPRAAVTPNVTLEAAEIEVLSSRLVSDSTAVFVKCDNFTLGPSSTLLFDGIVSIRAGTFLTIDGSATTWSDYDSSGAELQMWAGDQAYLELNCQLVVPILGIYSLGNMTLSGRIDNRLSAEAMEHVCEVPVFRRETCAEVDWDGESALPPESNYSLVLSSRLTSGVLLFDNNGIVTAHLTLLCGLGVEILSSMLATKRGCVTNTGWGAGKVGPTSDGGGGGHGGFGGASLSGGLGGTVYDSESSPLYPGSGGGSVYTANPSAGGFIVIEGALFIDTDAACIMADGFSSGTSGGGSGGAIVLRTSDLSGDGLISAVGGAGNSGSNGAGGGGGGGGLISLQAYDAPGFGIRAKLELISFVDAASIASDSRRLDLRTDLSLPRLLSRDPLPWLSALLCLDAEQDTPAPQRLTKRNCPRTVSQTRMSAARWADVAATFRDNLLAALEVPPWPQNASLFRATMALLNLAARKASLAVRVLDEYSQTTLLVDAPVASGSRRAASVGLAECTFSADGALHRRQASPPPERQVQHTRTALDTLQLSAMWATVLPGTSMTVNPSTPGSPQVAQNFDGAFVVSGGSGANPGGSGVISAPPCPAGFGGRPRCTECGFGAWRNGSSDAPYFCVPCSNKPSKGVYTDAQATSDDCEYVCAPGYLYPACRTPFDEVALVFGGLPGFISFVVAIISFLFLVLVVLYRRAVLASDALKLSAIDGRVRRTNFCCNARQVDTGQNARLLSGSAMYGASDDFSVRNSSASGSVSGMAAALTLLRSTKRGRCQCWSYGRDKSAVDFLVSATSLQEVDVPRHVHRIYFAGTNTFGSSWCLPTTLPASAMRHVHGRQYRELCAALNADLAWRDWSWERVLYLLCWCLCPPAGSYLNRWLRRRRVWAIMTRLLAGDESHRWLRGGVRAEALQDNIRVGISADFTLAFIDLLRTDDSLKRPRRRPRQAASRIAVSVPANPQPTASNLTLPLALLFAGEGTFECPHYLDPNDVLLRAVPGVAGLSRFIHLDWVDFVAELNVRTRCVVSGASIQTLGPLIAFVEAVNAAGQDGALGGLRVDVVRFWPESRTMASKRYSRTARGMKPRGGHDGGIPGAFPTPAPQVLRMSHEQAQPSPAIASPLRRDPLGSGRGAAVRSSVAAVAQPDERPMPQNTKGSNSTGSGSESSGSSSGTSATEDLRRRPAPAPMRTHSISASTPTRRRATSASAAMFAALESGASDDIAGGASAVPADVLWAAPSLDGFRRGRNEAGGGSSDDEAGAASGAGHEAEEVYTVADDEDEADDGTRLGIPMPSQVSSLSALKEDVIDLEGCRLGLLVSFAIAAAPAVAAISPSATAIATSRSTQLPRPSASLPAQSAHGASHRPAPLVEDDFQFGLGDEGVTVFPGVPRKAGAGSAQHRMLGFDAGALDASPRGLRGFQTGRVVAAFDLDADAGGLAAQSAARSHFSALLDGNSQRPVAPATGAYSAEGGLALLAPQVTQRRHLTQRGHDWQQGPVVVSRFSSAYLMRSAARPTSRRRRRFSRDDDHAAGTGDAEGSEVDEEEEDAMRGGRQGYGCCTPCCWLFGGLWAIGAALFRALDPARATDIGGHDDVIGQRIDLRLPYAGLPVTGTHRRAASDLATLATFLREPRRPRWCRLLCGSGAGRRRRAADPQQTLRSDAHSSRGIGAGRSAGAAASSRGLSGPQTSSALQSDDALPLVLNQALLVSATWAARTRVRSSRRRRRDLPLGFEDLEEDAAHGLSYEDGGDSSSSGGSSGSSFDGGAPAPEAGAPARGAARAHLASVEGFQLPPLHRHRRESFHSNSTSDSARHNRGGGGGFRGGGDAAPASLWHLHPYARPAPRWLLWAGGVSPAQLCDWRRGSLSFRRFLFVLARLFKRTSLPDPQPPAARVQAWAWAAAMHVVLMLADVAATVVLVSELWCVEPLADVNSVPGVPWVAAPAPLSAADAAAAGGGSGGGSSPVIVTHFLDQECNMGPLVLWAILPPGAFILPTLLGLGAVAVQSSRALRLYALWNAVSLWSAGLAAALVLAFARVLGLRVLAFPVLLLALKTAAAQCVGVQLHEIESGRPIRGWRGLFEVRTGPVERTSNADVRSEYRS